MSDPTPLRDDPSAPDALRDLLNTAASADPHYDGVAGLARLEAAIGAGAAGPTSGNPAGPTLAVRVAVVGATVALVVGLTLVVARLTPSASRPLPPSAPQSAPSSAPPSAPSPSAPPHTPSAPAQPHSVVAPSAPTQTHDGAPTTSERHAQQRAADPLALELRLVVDARRNTRTAAARALALLDRADREVGEGVLGRERETLRIEALASLGRSAQAERLARAFLAAHPGDPLERRVREAIRAAP